MNSLMDSLKFLFKDFIRNFFKASFSSFSSDSLKNMTQLNLPSKNSPCILPEIPPQICSGFPTFMIALAISLRIFSGLPLKIPFRNYFTELFRNSSKHCYTNSCKYFSRNTITNSKNAPTYSFQNSFMDCSYNSIKFSFKN